MYSVFTKLYDGEFLYVDSRDELKQAVNLAEELNVTWPREYVVRDSTGNDVHLIDLGAIKREHITASHIT